MKLRVFTRARAEQNTLYCGLSLHVIAGSDNQQQQQALGVL
jgi:hypothetical protein